VCSELQQYPDNKMEGNESLTGPQPSLDCLGDKMCIDAEAVASSWTNSNALNIINEP
jgi:hypothetical protein